MPVVTWDPWGVWGVWGVWGARWPIQEGCGGGAGGLVEMRCVAGLGMCRVVLDVVSGVSIPY